MVPPRITRSELTEDHVCPRCWGGLQTHANFSGFWCKLCKLWVYYEDLGVEMLVEAWDNQIHYLLTVACHVLRPDGTFKESRPHLKNMKWTRALGEQK